MHIAVCDDNIADRKQTERLLGRQSDRFFKDLGERIYIDSYGNIDAFMQHPQMYHGLFVDMVNSDVDGCQVAKMLLADGVTNPIVLCSSSIDYRKRIADEGINEPNIFFLDKPIKVADITATMDEIRKWMGDPIQTLELRGQHGTIYAKGDDIICVIKKGAELCVHLADGRIQVIMDDIYNFYDQCAIFPQICPVSDTTLININHIAKTAFMRVTMDNKSTYPVTLTYINSIKQAREICDRIAKEK